MERHEKKNGKAVNCWEFKKCGHEPGGEHAHDLGICPVTTTKKLNLLHGGKNAGRACWFVLGTLCNGTIQGTFAKKYKSCVYCDFYKKVKQEEFPDSRLHTANSRKKIRAAFP